jgi:hypothetical protein
MRTGRCEALQQARSCQWPQLTAERLRSRDQQVAELAEPGPFRVDCSLACSDKCLQCLAFTACARRRRPLLGEDAASGTDRVERVGLAARAALSPQTTNLEYPLVAAGEEARETCTE